MKADIFFFIAAITTVVLGIGLTVVVVYLIKIMRDVRYIMERARERTDSVLEYIDKFIEDAKRKQAKAFIFSELAKVFVKALLSDKDK
ncbi:MAG: hypothetical protein R3346_04715 [Candidatus Spechtbacterales bacterium]|nr:hypothetical protein [Candidatus Spechtbacterales bacterium]